MNDLFLDHFRHPRNTGVLDDAHGAGSAGDPVCGVAIEVFIRFDGGRIEAISCEATGSSAAIACGSMVTEMVTGREWRQAASISDAALAFPFAGGEGAKPSLRIAAMFAIEALHGALEDSLRRKTFPGSLRSSPESHDVTAAGVGEPVLVAMSGGVDSSAACLLLRDAGRDVLGITMRLWSDPDCAGSEAPTCCSPLAIRDARTVCHGLGLPHLTIDYSQEFATRVVDAFVDGYLSGLTPNPCTRCNGSFRFPALVGLADFLGISKVATGHYARLVESDGRLLISRAVDDAKDQSYMLWGIDPPLLPRLEFPLGGFRKEQTRSIARKAGMAVHDRPESQEVCFIPDDDYRRFVRSRAAVTGKGRLLPGEGDIVDEAGNRLGSHRGFIDFTIGQRHGLGVSAPEPLYVLRTVPEKNQVVAGGRDQLAVGRLKVGELNRFVGPEEFDPGASSGLSRGAGLFVQVRYNSRPAKVRSIRVEADSLHIELREPVSGVAPGQSAVIYREAIILAGGVIEEAF